jgi:hypothetical protein
MMMVGEIQGIGYEGFTTKVYFKESTVDGRTYVVVPRKLFFMAVLHTGVSICINPQKLPQPV